MKRIYVGNLPWSTTDEELQEAFAKFGAVNSAVVIKDRETGRSRGFGFVEMDGSDADKAIEEMNGQNMGSRAVAIQAQNGDCQVVAPSAYASAKAVFPRA